MPANENPDNAWGEHEDAAAAGGGSDARLTDQSLDALGDPEVVSQEPPEGERRRRNVSRMLILSLGALVVLGVAGWIVYRAVARPGAQAQDVHPLSRLPVAAPAAGAVAALEAPAPAAAPALAIATPAPAAPTVAAAPADSPGSTPIAPVAAQSGGPLAPSAPSAPSAVAAPAEKPAPPQQAAELALLRSDLAATRAEIARLERDLSAAKADAKRAQQQASTAAASARTASGDGVARVASATPKGENKPSRRRDAVITERAGQERVVTADATAATRAAVARMSLRSVYPLSGPHQQAWVDLGNGQLRAVAAGEQIGGARVQSIDATKMVLKTDHGDVLASR